MVAMGIGKLGLPGVIIKRKFRFTAVIDTPVGQISESFVKVAARPHLEIDEAEINFLNAYMSIPGKGKWQPITITYYDVGGIDGDIASSFSALYDWIATVYDYTSPEGIDIRQSEKQGWAAKTSITMFDGCGNPLERWVLHDCWPQTVNFGDLDYGSSELATIDLTIKYRYAQMEKVSECVAVPQTPVCFGCD